MSVFVGNQVSSAYANYRPEYPRSLFAGLASMSPNTGLAWDVACGTGQATSLLADFFDKVVGSDQSVTQLEHAVRRADKIWYKECSAEESQEDIRAKLGIELLSVDLITVAQALHWIDPKPFFENAKHFLRPGGLIAIISYNWPTFPENPLLTELVLQMANEVLAPYWAPRCKDVGNHFRDIEFPFEIVVDGYDKPYTSMEATWTLEVMFGNIRSWSGYQSALKELNGEDPLDQIKQEMTEAWGSSEHYQVIYPIYLLLGRSN